MYAPRAVVRKRLCKDRIGRRGGGSYGLSSSLQCALRRPAQLRILRIFFLAVCAEAVLVAAACTKTTFIVAV